MPTQEYIKKRDFKKTPEPRARTVKKKAKAALHMFVVQEHHASHLHYDFRLEFNGVLKSWAVPKGPSLDPKIKRLAVEVEDHPVPYGSFEGTIPEGHYGAGDVYIWDTGIWEPVGSPRAGFKKGHLQFELKGKRLQGRWDLVRTGSSSGKKAQWLLMKRTDRYAKTGDVAKEIATERKRQTAKATIKRLPDFIAPQLALLVDTPPSGKAWLHETKYDGYRTQAHVTNGKRQLFTRSGLDWSKKYPSIIAGLADFPVTNVILDGEIVWLDKNGRSDFQRLQNALKEKDHGRMIFYVFDILFLDGKDLRDQPLIERKELLQNLLKQHKNKIIRFSDHVVGHASEFLKAACAHSLEGIISKNSESLYKSGRGDTWLKSKCKMHQEFVIGGYTEGEGARADFGALLLGVYERGKLCYVGRTGTGFSHKSIQEIKAKLKKWERKDSPFELKSPKGRGLHWIKPGLVAEVTFANWTEEKVLRAAVFHGLREDKAASDIHIERPKALKNRTTRKVPVLKDAARRKTKGDKESLEISSPEKILYKKEKITKLEVAQYYQDIADLILPHLENRPLNLLRCPAGTSASCFFQKHAAGKMPDNIDPVQITEKSGTKTYMTLDSKEGLLALSQISAFEIHAWGSRKDSLEYPDQIVMDFDPGPGVTWKKVVAAAFDLKKLLDQLKLKSFVKVSGGKGVHVHIPIKPIYDWDQIKEFSKTLAQEMSSQSPNLYTPSISKKDRNKKIFVDYLRNGRGATAVMPYSLRAREKSSVAMPISWNELKTIKSSDQFSLAKALQYLEKRKVNPWKDFFKSSQKISILKPKIAI